MARHAADAPASDADSEQRRPTEVSERTAFGGLPSPEAAGGQQDQAGSLRSAMAGRLLFSAIKSDLMAFGRYLTQLRGAALAKWRRTADQDAKRTR